VQLNSATGIIVRYYFVRTSSRSHVTEILQLDWNACIWSGQVIDTELPDPFLSLLTHIKEGT